ncbi:MAG TPA: hypothetical protein GYA07_09675 [Verrucomicrobia bacterium]|nr:hypothetical protein [Verrucomicrobiota bacterium]HOB32886.1 hypothetical protein [Verrucomicrobiota bacterium]HOP98351.1 hypothetical protein [Verrucomicrobiota bacterium]HPU55708.1 hypothetical protein [Verrucomicrobiota bacterium]
MNFQFPSVEFDAAVAAVCHGVATEEVMRNLNVLLRKNAAARDEYIRRVEVHARLASEPDLFNSTCFDVCAALPGQARHCEWVAC